MYSRKFIKKFNEARTFAEWLERLKRFDFALIKENSLQAWTVADYKKLWNTHKAVKV